MWAGYRGDIGEKWARYRRTRVGYASLGHQLQISCLVPDRSPCRSWVVVGVGVGGGGGGALWVAC